jgi:hypothetical protein
MLACTADRPYHRSTGYCLVTRAAGKCSPCMLPPEDYPVAAHLVAMVILPAAHLVAMVILPAAHLVAMVILPAAHLVAMVILPALHA